MEGSVWYGASYGPDVYPGDEAIDRAGETLRFRLVPGDQPIGVRGLLEAWRGVAVNGGAFAASFVIEGVEPAAEWCFRNGQLRGLDLTRRLVTSAAMLEALPDHAPGPMQLAEAKFEDEDPLLLDATMALRLKWGGAHKEFPGTAAQAKAIGRDAAEALIGDRYEEFAVISSFDAWAAWFGWVAWDRTWIVIDRTARALTVVALTDTD